MLNNPFVRWLLDIDRIPQGAEGVRLAWGRGWPAWMWFLLLLAAAGFSLWSYWRIAGDRRGRGVLAAARSAILLVILILICEPMLELPRENTQEDWVIVLADRSESLRIQDATLDSSTDRVSRDEQLRAILDDSAPIWRDIDRDREVLWLGFHDGVFDLQKAESAPAESPEGGGDAALPPVVLDDPTGSRTQIGAALSQALQRAAARPVSGVVLFSDGQTPDAPARALLRRFQSEQIAVHVVPLGSAEPLGDLAIKSIDAPRRAFVRDKVPVVVELDSFGEGALRPGTTMRLSDAETGELLDEAAIDQQSTNESITLTGEPQLAGETTWQIEVVTADPDLVPENNSRSFAIELIDRPLRVLYVDGYPRWEYRYLKWLLIREKSIESSIMLLSADRDFAQEGNMPITRLPRSPEELRIYDVVIIGDVPGTFFAPGQIEMIRDHVANGAGMLWIAGERALPQTYVGTAGGLADLLPIRPPLTLATVDEPVNMVPTAYAERLGVLNLVSGEDVGWPGELADPSFGWSRLWWAQRIPAAQLKPTAQALATTADPVRGVHLPLVMHMRYGSGQTIYVATDEIWRWRYGRGDYLPEQFWLQMIRMLGRESLAADDEPAVLEVEPRRLATGQPIHISLRLLDAQRAEEGPETIPATLETTDGEPVGDIVLRRAGPDDAEYTATFITDTPGHLRVRVHDPATGPEPLFAEAEVFNPDHELRRPETDHALLESIAAETGGEVLSPADLSKLPQILPDRSLTTDNPLTERIWDTPLFFLLVILLLTAEWIGRRVLRLV
jgi:hypothetical protein